MSTAERLENSSSNDWGLILLQGIAALILGVFLVSAPSLATVALVTFLGAYWLITGILSFVRIITGSGRAHWGWSLVVGTLGVLAGLIVLRHPLYAAVLAPTVLVFILGINALLMGLVNLGRTFAGDGAAFAVAGILDVIFGLLLLGAPLVAASVLPIVIGAFAVLGGVALIGFAFNLRSKPPQAAVFEQKRAA